MPEWIYLSVFTVVLTGLGWILKDLYLAIKELTKVTFKQGEMISMLQQQVTSSVNEIRQSAVRAERQSICNADDIVDHETRIVKIETEHNLFHKTKKEN